jgi:hypothetical protein
MPKDKPVHIIGITLGGRNQLQSIQVHYSNGVDSHLYSCESYVQGKEKHIEVEGSLIKKVSLKVNRYGFINVFKLQDE